MVTDVMMVCEVNALLSMMKFPKVGDVNEMQSMRINMGKYGMRGGRRDLLSQESSSVSLSGRDGGVNWSKLRREIELAMWEVSNDSGDPGLVQRIDIQIQKGVVR